MTHRLTLPGLWLALACACRAAPPADHPWPVFRDGKAGFVAGDGSLLAAPRYEAAGRWSEGRIWVQERYGGTQSGRFLDEQARPLPADTEMRNLADLLPEQPLPCFQRGLAVVGLADGAYGYVNREGRLLGRTSRAGAFLRQDDPLLLIAEGRHMGYMDRTGTVKIAPQFDEARPFRGGRAPAAESGRWGLIDENGAWVAKPAFDDLWWFADEPRIWNYRLKGKRGLLHRDGALLTEARFDDFGVPCGGVVSVRQENRWGLMTVGGHLCVAPRYAALEPPPAATGHWWMAQSAAGRWGLVGTNGQEQVPCVYERIEALAPGCWAGWSEGRAGLLDPARGGFRDTARYERLVSLAPASDAHALAMRQGKWGVIDLASGRVLVPFEYERLMPWEAGLAGQRGDQVHLLDATPAVHKRWKGKLDEWTDGAGALRAAAGDTPAQADADRPWKARFEASGRPWNGLHPARRAGRWGLVDENGNEVLACEYDGMEWGMDARGEPLRYGWDPARHPGFDAGFLDREGM
jgi:hypothetical protein